MEKLWLVIFNYKKYNKNYIDLKTTDFPIYNYNLTIKQNTINFKLFNITCNIYLNLIIDNKKYSITINKNIINLKYDKSLFKKEITFDKLIQNIIKDVSYITIEIKLLNNNLIVLFNNFEMINYKFMYKVNKIETASILLLTKDNQLVDLLNPKSNNKILEKYL
jgi:hypothetical protein